MAHVTGQVLGGGAPVERATVTLWAATAGAPVQLGEVATGADGRLTVNSAAVSARDTSLYLVAEGGRSSADKTGGENEPHGADDGAGQ
jgi:5-hydroxyisourate hydrolase-like protein (transthyretin family)